MSILKYIFFVLVMFIPAKIVAKKVPKYIRQNFTNCYNGQSTQIRSLINIDGYYKESKLRNPNPGYNNSSLQTDSNNNIIIFYEDGTFVYNVSVDGLNTRSNVCLYLEKISKAPDKYGFYISGYWGVYRIKGDALILQYIHKRGSLNDNWFGFEVWYKVIDRNSIVLIDAMSKPLHRELRQSKNYETYLKNLRDQQLVSPAKFTNCEHIPPPDCWLKQEDWLWCKDKVE
jgi:hypothetical protein